MFYRIDPPNTELITRRSIVNDFREAAQWLTSLGIDYSNTRFGRYEKYLSELEASRLVFRFIDHNAYDAGVEASELILIHQGLSKMELIDVFIEKLHNFVTGPLHATQEQIGRGSSQRPRDYGFELAIGAHFALGGFAVRFTKEADIEISDGKTIFYLECKRPKKHGTIRNNLREAYSQLKRRYENHSYDLPPRGLVAISLNKLVNPEYLTMLYPNEVVLNRTIKDFLQRFMEQRRSLWNTDLDNRTMGVIGYLLIPAALQNRRGRMFARFMSSIYVSNIHNTNIMAGDPDRLYFNEIHRRLNQGPRKLFQDQPFLSKNATF